MARKKKRSKVSKTMARLNRAMAPVRKHVRTILRLIGLAKGKATGKTWTRLHRLESEAATIMGTKQPDRSKKKVAKKKRSRSKA